MMIITERILFAMCMWSVNVAATETGHAGAYWRTRGSQAVAVCQEVGRRADRAGLALPEVLAVSFVETRHRKNLTSSRGAKGPLQALPKYWARPSDRDHIDAGLRAWAYYRRRSSSVQGAAGKYNGGGKGSRYARDVRRHYELLQRVRRVARWPV